MEDLFLKLFNMSVTAGWVTLALIAVRLIFRKLPKRVLCALWGLVGLRLMLPFSFGSVISLIPSTETLSSDPVGNPVISSGFGAFNTVVNPIFGGNSGAFGAAADPVLSGNAAASPAGSAVLQRTPWESFLSAASYVWLAGIALMLAWTLFSYLRVKRQVRESVPAEKNVFYCDDLPSPFILGFFRPKIYLPSDADGAEREFILTHERTHLKRLDHLWKPLGFLLLSLYWFDPLLWIAYILLTRDVEAACDERVIKNYSDRERAMYSQTILRFSAPRRAVSACPVAFGETGVKSRIKSVLNYKKPTVWIVAAALILSAVLTAVFLTDPKKTGAPKSVEEAAGRYSLDVSDPRPMGNPSFDLDADGTFWFSPGVAVSIAEHGEWSLELGGKRLTLRSPDDRRYVFIWNGEGYVYKTKKSAPWDPLKTLPDGTTFVPESRFDGYVFLDGGSENARVKMESCTLTGTNKQVVFRFLNDSDKTLFYGLDLRLYRLLNDGTSLEEIELPPHTLEEYALKPGAKSEKIVFSVPDGLDLSETYRIEADYRIAEDRDDASYQNKYTALVFFGGVEFDELLSDMVEDLDSAKDRDLSANEQLPGEYVPDIIYRRGWTPSFQIFNGGGETPTYNLLFGDMSSIMSVGRVEADGKDVIFTDDSGGGIYVFRKKGETLAFDAKRSTGTRQGDLSDGTVFIRDAPIRHGGDVESGNVQVGVRVESVTMKRHGAGIVFQIFNNSERKLFYDGAYRLLEDENEKHDIAVSDRSPTLVKPGGKSESITVDLPDPFEYGKEYRLDMDYYLAERSKDDPDAQLCTLSICFGGSAPADDAAKVKGSILMPGMDIKRCENEIDVDGDGEKETVVVAFRGFSGTAFYIIEVWKNGEAIASLTDQFSLYDLSFREEPNGDVFLRLEKSEGYDRMFPEEADEPSVYHLDVRIEDGKIRLYRNDTGEEFKTVLQRMDENKPVEYVCISSPQQRDLLSVLSLNDYNGAFSLSLGSLNGLGATAGSFERTDDGWALCTDDLDGYLWAFEGGTVYRGDKSTAEADLLSDGAEFAPIVNTNYIDLDGDKTVTDALYLIDCGLTREVSYPLITDASASGSDETEYRVYLLRTVIDDQTGGFAPGTLGDELRFCVPSSLSADFGYITNELGFVQRPGNGAYLRVCRAGEADRTEPSASDCIHIAASADGKLALENVEENTGYRITEE